MEGGHARRCCRGVPRNHDWPCGAWYVCVRCCLCHLYHAIALLSSLSTEAHRGGPLALVQDDDMISYDLVNFQLNLELDAYVCLLASPPLSLTQSPCAEALLRNARRTGRRVPRPPGHAHGLAVTPNMWTMRPMGLLCIE